MSKVGWSVAVVVMAYAPEKLQQFGPPEALASQLITEELGRFDSVQQGDPFKLFFYLNSKTLAAGLRFITQRLEQLGLLSLAKVGYADCGDNLWRTFFPGLGSDAGGNA